MHEEVTVGKPDSGGRVVVGVDGSPGSLAALRFAFDEAKRRVTGLLVVSAFEFPDIWSITYGVPVQGSVDEVHDTVVKNTQQALTDTLGDQLSADGAQS
jgi:nucleotide-binding universal stress UspA family protein